MAASAPNYHTRQFKIGKATITSRGEEHGTVRRENGGNSRWHERHGTRDGEDAPRWGCARSSDGSLAGRPGFGAARAWNGRHRGFERRPFVDGHRRPRPAGEG